MNVKSYLPMLMVVILLYANQLSAELLFEDNFDNQADWISEADLSNLTLPTGWDAGRTNEAWHPDNFPDAHASMMVLGDDPNQVFGGTGKAFISYSESFNDLENNGFASDGFITKEIPPSDEVFVQFMLKFQPGFASNTNGGQIKLFRALSWDGVDPRNKFFNDGNSAPIYLFDWAQNQFGARQFHAFRCDDQRTTYFCTTPTITGAPRAIVTGDMSANFTSDLQDVSPAPVIVDQTDTSKIIPKSGTAFHNQVWGDVWHKVEFYLKLNSAPEVRDGILQFWLDDQLVLDMNQIPWIGSNGSMDAKWNSISFGGNDRYHFNLDELAPKSERERWYAIDNIRIFNNHKSAPNPPSQLSIRN